MWPKCETGFASRYKLFTHTKKSIKKKNKRDRAMHSKAPFASVSHHLDGV